MVHRLAKQRGQLGERLLKPVAVVRFHVQAQQRFRVRRANVEPPVLVLHRDAIEVVDLGVVVLVGEAFQRPSLSSFSKFRSPLLTYTWSGSMSCDSDFMLRVRALRMAMNAIMPESQK